MSTQQLIELRNQLDGMLQTIRTERNILPPLMICSHCGLKSRAARPKVSVRAMILALSRFRIALVHWTTKNEQPPSGNENCEANVSFETIAGID